MLKDKEKCLVERGLRVDREAPVKRKWTGGSRVSRHMCLVSAVICTAGSVGAGRTTALTSAWFCLSEVWGRSSPNKELDQAVVLLMQCVGPHKFQV